MINPPKDLEPSNGSGSPSGSGIATDKINACNAMQVGEDCTYIYNGVAYKGKCKLYFGTLYCTDLNKDGDYRL